MYCRAFIKAGIVGILALVLSACATTKSADKSIAQASADADGVSRSSHPYTRPTLAVVDGYWVSTDPVPTGKFKKLPPQFSLPRTIRGTDLALAWALADILADTGFNAVYSTSVKQNGRVSINYSGDLAGALNAIASATGYHWELRGNNIYWDDMETRTWLIPMVPGTSSYQSVVGGAVTTSIAGSGGSGTTSNPTSFAGDTSGTSSGTTFGNTQKTERKSDAISIWGDLSKEVRNLMSPRGTIDVSESTSSITVRDYAERLNEIDTFISRIKDELTRQVMVQVDVIEVTLDKGSNAGIDWNAIAQNLGHYGFAFTTSSADKIFPSDFVAPTLSYTNLGGGKLNGTQVLVKALQTQGDVSVKTQPRVITLNNQLATLQIGSEVGYLAESTTQVTQGVGSTTTLTPGVAKSGFMMYLLPRIMPSGDITMQMSLSINAIKQIRTVSSGGNLIEIPEIQTKNFQQVTKLESGQAMVLTGFRQMTNSHDAAGVTRVFPWLFGAESGNNTKVDTVIVITPYVLSEKA